MNPLVVGITGGSASGKSTFAEALGRSLDDLSPVIVNQDRYFRNWMDYPEEVRESVRTANHPRAILWDALRDQIARLKAGKPISEPAKGTRASDRGGEEKSFGPSSLVIVEGHLIFWHKPLRDLLSLRIYIDADPHERVLRRMLRDTNRRGNLEQAVSWYRRDVLPNFPIYTAPTRRFADVVVPFDQHNQAALEVIASGLRKMLE